jgi:hypothetical protein
VCGQVSNIWIFCDEIHLSPFLLPESFLGTNLHYTLEEW